MTLLEFSKLVDFNTKIQVISGYNGKILCKDFKSEKHIDIAGREITRVIPCIKVSSNDKQYAHSYIEAWVFGDIEYNKEHGKAKEKGKNDN